MHNGEHETVKLTKDVSWEEEEEEVTEHYLKIYAKYITDGQVNIQVLESYDFFYQNSIRSSRSL